MTNTSEVAARARIIIRKPPAEVFDAFSDPAKMSRFWFTRKDQGLREGERIGWFVGDAPDAFEIEVRVKSILPPSSIVVEWGHDDAFTTVTWLLSEPSPGITRLSIEERDFKGTPEEIVSQALDSTSGFNQLVVALKAFVEHGVAINIVADHA